MRIYHTNKQRAYNVYNAKGKTGSIQLHISTKPKREQVEAMNSKTQMPEKKKKQSVQYMGGQKTPDRGGEESILTCGIDRFLPWNTEQRKRANYFGFLCFSLPMEEPRNRAPCVYFSRQTSTITYRVFFFLVK